MEIKVGDYYKHRKDDDIVLINDIDGDNYTVHITIIEDITDSWCLYEDEDRTRQWDSIEDFKEKYAPHAPYNSPLYKVLNG
jgi:hypothetical protein